MCDEVLNELYKRGVFDEENEGLEGMHAKYRCLG